MKNISEEIIKELNDQGYSDLKYIEGRGICGVRRFMFTTGLVYGIDDYGYAGRYCYTHNFDARKALRDWDGVGDPGDDQWIKHKGGIGEYRNPKSTDIYYD